jgi:hypothetical protein
VTTTQKQNQELMPEKTIPTFAAVFLIALIAVALLPLAIALRPGLTTVAPRVDEVTVYQFCDGDCPDQDALSTNVALRLEVQYVLVDVNYNQSLVQRFQVSKLPATVVARRLQYPDGSVHIIKTGRFGSVDATALGALIDDIRLRNVEIPVDRQPLY